MKSSSFDPNDHCKAAKHLKLRHLVTQTAAVRSCIVKCSVESPYSIKGAILNDAPLYSHRFQSTCKVTHYIARRRVMLDSHFFCECEPETVYIQYSRYRTNKGDQRGLWGGEFCPDALRRTPQGRIQAETGSRVIHRSTSRSTSFLIDTVEYASTRVWRCRSRLGTANPVDDKVRGVLNQALSTASSNVTDKHPYSVDSVQTPNQTHTRLEQDHQNRTQRMALP